MSMRARRLVPSPVPFDLTPTNMPGAFVPEAVPADFDPLTATTASMMRHGMFGHLPIMTVHPARSPLGKLRCQNPGFIRNG